MSIIDSDQTLEFISMKFCSQVRRHKTSDEFSNGKNFRKHYKIALVLNKYRTIYIEYLMVFENQPHQTWLVKTA